MIAKKKEPSNKDRVKEVHKSALAVKEGNKVFIMSSKMKSAKRLSIAKNETDAWKKALHSVL